MKKLLKFLFVCAGNINRSIAFENWFKRNRPEYDVRSTGTAHAYPFRMNRELLEWADRIFLMDLEQEMFMTAKFPEFLYKTEIIGIKDRYDRESPILYELIEYWANKKGLQVNIVDRVIWKWKSTLKNLRFDTKVVIS